MQSTVVTIKYVNPPKDGFKPSIKATEGSTFGCKEDKLALFEIGKTYRIEYSEKSWNGKTYRNVESATAIETAGAGTTAVASATTGGHGGGTYRDASEQIFVCALLKEMIRAGHVTNDKRQLWETTNTLRGLWRATFGDGNTFLASEAQSGKQAARG